MIYRDETIKKNEVLKFLKITSVPQFPMLIKTMQIAFVWPLQKKYVKLIGRSFIIISLLISFISSGIKLWMILKENDLISFTVVDNMFQLIACFSGLACYIFVIFNDDKIITCMSIITRIFQGNDTVGQKILMKTVKKAITIHWFEMAMGIPFFANWSVAPIVQIVLSTDDEQLSNALPLKLAYFFDEDKYFFYVFAFQIIIVFICFLVYALGNYLQWLLVGFIIGEIQCLTYCLKKMDFEYEHRNFVLNCTKNTFFYIKLREITRQHQNCIKLFDKFCYMSSSLNFIVILCVSVGIVLTGTWFAMLWDENKTEAGKVLMAFMAYLLVNIAICIPSQLLSNSTSDFFLESYFLKWYNYPPKARLFLLLLMTRSMKDFVITCGPLVPLNIETCSLIIKRSMSFIGAFRSVFLALK